MALDLIGELEALVDGFEQDGVEYALCGGLAVAVHGHPRATMDIDVLLPGDQLHKALSVAKRVGFDLRARKMTFGLRTGTPREVHRVSKVDPDTNELMSLDLIVVGSGLDEPWRDRLIVSWRGRKLPIVSRQGLVTMKRIAGRPQDLADVAALEGTNDEET